MDSQDWKVEFAKRAGAALVILASAYLVKAWWGSGK